MAGKHGLATNLSSYDIMPTALCTKPPPNNEPHLMAKKKKQKRTVKPVRETELGDGIKVKLPETQTLITRALALNKAGNRIDAQLTMQRAVRLETDNAPLVYLLSKLFFESP